MIQYLGSCSGPHWDSTSVKGLVSVLFQARDMKEKVQSGEVAAGVFSKICPCPVDWVFFLYIKKIILVKKKFTAS